MNEPILTLVGNLTADPEVKHVAGGQAVCNFTVASTPRTLNKQTDQWEDGEAMFVRCAVWREYGENVANSLVKGARVIVQGRLQVRSYEKDGQTRTSLELLVDEVGPSLRYATARVERTTGQGARYGAQGASGARQGSRGGGGGFAAPQGDPWASQQVLDEAPPF